MADDYTKGPESTDYVQLGGVPYRAVGDEQAASMVRAGGAPMAQEQAKQAFQAQKDLSYVDQNWGTAGKFGLGALSGLSLGLAPGLMARAGLMEPGHIQAAQASPWFTAGDIGGTIAPALLSGGESLLGRGLSFTPAGLMARAGGAAERLAGGVLAESPGLMGRMAAAPLQMAARGATEGALISMGHNIGDSLVTNKPLAAESIAASGLDGALFGGLIGGTLGAVGSIGSKAVESMGDMTKSVIGKNSRALGLVAKDMGYDATDVAIADKEFKGGSKAFLKASGDVLEEGGSKVGDSTTGKIQGVKNTIQKTEAIRNGVVDELNKSAPTMVPSVERLQSRIKQDVLVPRMGTAAEAGASNELESFWKGFVSEKPLGRASWNRKNNFRSYAQWIEDGHGEGLQGSAKRAAYDDYKSSMDLQHESYRKNFHVDQLSRNFPNSWKGLVEARDNLAAKIQPGVDSIKRDILNSLDSEIRFAMDSSGVEGAADKYGAATQRISLAKRLEATLGKKGADAMLSTEPNITARDMLWAGTGAALGHPTSAISYLAGKGIGRQIAARAEPWMAQMAYNQSFGAKAAQATQDVQSKVSGSIKKFFSNAAKTPAKAAPVVKAERSKELSKEDTNTREHYEAMATRVEQLLSDNHQEKVRMYANSLEQAGYGDLAAELMGVNQRAVMYATNIMPPRQGTKAMKSLRPQPISKVQTLEEMRTVRKLKGIGIGKHGPLSLLDDLETGKLSKDSVKAAAYVMPEIWGPGGLVAKEVANSIYEMKVSGKYLPMDKIQTLGIALDTPVDSTQEHVFINGVQASFAPVQQDRGQPGGQPPQQPANMTIPATGLMTPLQQNVMG